MLICISDFLIQLFFILPESFSLSPRDPCTGAPRSSHEHLLSSCEINPTVGPRATLNVVAPCLLSTPLANYSSSLYGAATLSFTATSLCSLSSFPSGDRASCNAHYSSSGELFTGDEHKTRVCLPNPPSSHPVTRNQTLKFLTNDIYIQILPTKFNLFNNYYWVKSSLTFYLLNSISLHVSISHDQV
jgi:hypothetical protein